MKNINLKSSILLSFLSLGIMYLLYGLTQAKMFGDNPVGQGTSFDAPMIVPAGYAFSIWGVIYLGITIFPIYQWFTHREGHPLWKHVHYWFSANLIANGLWLAFASMDWMILTVLVIAFMLFSLVKIIDLLIKIKADKGIVNYWPEQFVFEVYFGWITLATALNVTAALVYYQWDGFNFGEIPWSLAILVVASMISALVFKKYKAVPFAGVVIWAFTALVVKHIGQNNALVILAAVVIIFFAALIIISLFKKGRNPKINLATKI